MNRWPTILLLIAIISALVFADQRVDDAAAEMPAPASATGPTIAGPGASGNTWYCPAGFTTPDGVNDHIVTITNRSDQPALGSLTVYPALFDVLGDPVIFERAVQPVDVAPGSQRQISLAPIVASLDSNLATNTGSFVGALVEFDGAGVTVEHTVMAPQGADSGACATSASSQWWFASGTTTADVRYLLFLLNPFPDDAVVDLTFVRDDGSRTPTTFDGRLIKAQSLTVLDVSPVMPVWEQITAEITTRTGRVIVERMQLFDNEEGPHGLSMTLGSNALSDQWFFPAGRAVPEAGESYVIFNPTEEPAEIEFELKPDSADREGDVAPLQVAIGPRERWVVNVSTHESHPVDIVARVDATGLVDAGQRYFVSIRSFNGVPFVAERVLTVPLERGAGVASSLGITRASTDQMISLPSIAEDDLDPGASDTLAVLNPAGNSISQVQIWVGGPDGEELRATVELAPRRRAVFHLDSLISVDSQWIRITSTTGTMAELVVRRGSTVLVGAAIPVEGTTSQPDLLAFD